MAGMTAYTGFFHVAKSQRKVKYVFVSADQALLARSLASLHRLFLADPGIRVRVLFQRCLHAGFDPPHLSTH
jgi:hypothetical protein